MGKSAIRLRMRSLRRWTLPRRDLEGEAAFTSVPWEAPVSAIPTCQALPSDLVPPAKISPRSISTSPNPRALSSSLILVGDISLGDAVECKRHTLTLKYNLLRRQPYVLGSDEVENQTAHSSGWDHWVKHSGTEKCCANVVQSRCTVTSNAPPVSWVN